MCEERITLVHSRYLLWEKLEKKCVDFHPSWTAPMAAFSACELLDFLEDRLAHL
jgi:hypothetical protein